MDRHVQSMPLCFDRIKNITRNMTTSEEDRLFALGVINSVFAVSTAAANALVIVAILTTSSLRTPSYLLMTSLAFSDLAVALLGQSFFSFGLFFLRNGKAKAYCYAGWISQFFLVFLTSVTILTVVAISVDRYLAIRLKMRYRSVVTVRRVRCIIMSVWFYSIFAAFYPFYMSSITTSILASSKLVMCLIIILVFYTMSFRALKIHCSQTQPQGNQQPNSAIQYNTAIDVLKYRKLLKTMIFIVVLVIVCYLPLLAIFFMLANRSTIGILVAWSLYNITALNSLLNPVIYMTRMNDLRHVCLQVLRKMLRMGSM